jgi:hypothetical protein
LWLWPSRAAAVLRTPAACSAAGVVWCGVCFPSQPLRLFPASRFSISLPIDIEMSLLLIYAWTSIGLLDIKFILKFHYIKKKIFYHIKILAYI